MRRRKQRDKETSQSLCRCEEIPIGTQIRDEEAYTEHFHHVAWDPNAWSGYYICPLTGVVWHKVFTGNPRVAYWDYVRTRHQQSSLQKRTVLEGYLKVFSEVRNRADFESPKIVYRMPLSGLVRQPVETETRWSIDGIGIDGKQVLSIWMYLSDPLGWGEEGSVLFASPLEAVSDDAFPLGQHLLLSYILGVKAGEIGTIEVVDRRIVEIETFHQIFGYDKSYSTVAELEWG